MDTCHIFYHQMFNSEDSIILLDNLKNKIAKSPYPVENNVSTMYQIWKMICIQIIFPQNHPFVN